MTLNLDDRNTTWRLFLTAYSKLVDLIEQELALAELPPLMWYNVLVELSESPDHRLRMHELADIMVLDRSNLTRLVDRLEAKGLACRKFCPSDRRGAYAAITEEGSSMRQKMWLVYEQAIAKYFGCHLSDQEVAMFSKALKRMIAGTQERAS